jgi:hypothetical protein
LPELQISELHPTSTRHHTTKMSRIEEVLAAIRILDEGEQFACTNIGNAYGVSRDTRLEDTTTFEPLEQSR